MDQVTITHLTRRGIRELKPGFYSDTDIENMTTQVGVPVLGMRIKEGDPSYYNTRKSIASNTHVFEKPSDCLDILRVWDLDTTALTVSTCANNGSGLVRVTFTAAHGLSDAAIIVLHDIGGTTEANGTFQVDYSTTTHTTAQVDLVGSTFTNTYTSGGKAYEDPERPIKIEKKNIREATLDDDRGWYPRGNYIVVDDKDFTNDIMIDYVKRPSAITDIPAEYHMGLVAFNVTTMIRIPEQTDSKYFDLANSNNLHKSLLELVFTQIDQTFKVSREPEDIATGIDFEDFM